MIITFGTQKGGTGKTTIAMALANYLAIEKKRKVFVYDFDYQKSFFKRWDLDNKKGEIAPIYDVKIVEEQEDLPFKDIDDVTSLKESQDIHIFDLGGMLDNRYSYLLIYSDILIVPFEYSNMCFESTLAFLDSFGQSEASIIFIGNRYDFEYNYPDEHYMNINLYNYGHIIPTPIYRNNVLQKINTREFKKKIKDAIKSNLDELIDSINELTDYKYSL